MTTWLTGWLPTWLASGARGLARRLTTRLEYTAYPIITRMLSVCTRSTIRIPRRSLEVSECTQLTCRASVSGGPSFIPGITNTASLSISATLTYCRVRIPSATSRALIRSAVIRVVRVVELAYCTARANRVSTSNLERRRSTCNTSITNARATISSRTLTRRLGRSTSCTRTGSGILRSTCQCSSSSCCTIRAYRHQLASIR